jgi:dTDP-4-amino-4,6-dideoxygalactose transaminase
LDLIVEDLREVWSSGIVTVGQLVRRLEAATCEVTGAQHTIAVSSCTSGLMLAMRALDLTGEVVLPSFTFTATGLAALWNGLTPVFADIDAATWNLDPAAAREVITERTSALIPVYVFGNPPDMAGLQAVAREAGIPVLTDAAQAIGATLGEGRAGSLADIEVFSLSPTKVVTGLEGGLITTGDAVLAERLRRLRDYGKAPDGMDILEAGLSARMSEVHGAIGHRSLLALERLMTHRLRLMERYRGHLQDLPGISFQATEPGARTSGNYMVVAVDGGVAPFDRDALHDLLLKAGIQTKKYFHPALHQQTVYRELRAASEGRLAVTERVASRTLALPLYGHMEEHVVDEIAREIRRAFRAP